MERTSADTGGVVRRFTLSLTAEETRALYGALGAADTPCSMEVSLPDPVTRRRRVSLSCGTDDAERIAETVCMITGKEDGNETE